MNAWNGRAFYYRYARSWGPLAALKRAEDAAAEALLTQIAPVPKVYLDLGCGLRAPLPCLRTAARVGVDAAVSMLRKSAPTQGFQPLCGDVRHLPCKAGQFSLAIAIGVSEYLKNTIWFAEVARLLKPGGFFLLTATAPGIWALSRHLTGSRIYGHSQDEILRDAAAAELRLLGAKQLWTQDIYLFQVQGGRTRPR